MEKRILVICEINDYITSIKRHYSLTKGFGIATGLAKLSKVFYLTKGITQEKDGLILKNLNEIDIEFMNSIDYILLIREHNIFEVLDSNTAIKDTLLNFNKKHKVGMKSDAIEWLWDKKYIKDFKKKYNISWHDFIEKGFDIICCQMKEYKKQALQLIKNRIFNKDPEFYINLNNKLFNSRMGVFDKYPYTDDMKNPYDLNHSYCVDIGRSLSEGKALKPLCYTEKNYKYSNDPKKEKFNISKTILIYMGRLKTDSGKILYMMRDIMKKLGPKYELHIFPGRFVIPDCPVSVFSNKYGENLQILRDVIFNSNNNIIIHYPYDDKTKAKYLKYADIGIDFSSTRPKNIKTLQGNAKLLEYCAYGLKVVTERNVINSFLVDDAKNGICLKDIGTVEHYVNAIKEVEKMNYDRDYAINTTLKTQSWDNIGKELFEHFESLI
ncbi:MAG: hypothetical protein CMF62_01900 [Magnetococcales bacterium]|nr:hypothetical protein [Magnetococcales bacterium]|tara:strand:+ start:107534 stop:108847 length:1314 start_codon:yes stop_codon:yes gene_type:complete